MCTISPAFLPWHSKQSLTNISSYFRKWCSRSSAFIWASCGYTRIGEQEAIEPPRVINHCRWVTKRKGKEKRRKGKACGHLSWKGLFDGKRLQRPHVPSHARTCCRIEVISARRKRCKTPGSKLSARGENVAKPTHLEYDHPPRLKWGRLCNLEWEWGTDMFITYDAF